MKRFTKLLALVFFSVMMVNVLTAQTVTVTGATGTAGPYTTLGAAFTAINGTAQTGNTITITISGTTNEGTATAILNAGAWTSITINPTGGAAATVAGATTAGSPLIDLSGAGNVTINGLNTGGNTLTIENSTVSATAGTSTIRFINDASNNTITNCFINGASTMASGTFGGNIYFATGINTGNDNNTISNCNIGPSGSNLPAMGICGSGTTTSTTRANSGISITNNNIFDFFRTSSSSAGIYTFGGCNTWSITNNKFYQTATRTFTGGGQHSAIWLQSIPTSGGMQGATVTGNTIGYATNTQTGTYTLTGSGGKFIGILLTAITGGTSNTISSNTIAAISLTGVTSTGTNSGSPFSGIVVNSGVVTSSNNIIGSQSASGSLVFSTNNSSNTEVYGMLNSSADDWTSNSNTIGGISATNAGSGTTFIYGMRANMGTANIWTGNLNTVGGTASGSIQLDATGLASQVVGMSSPSTVSLTSNIVRNLSSNIGTGTDVGASVIGISISTNTVINTLSQNIVHSLDNTNTSTATTVTGILFTGDYLSIVERNFIHSLNNASTTGIINGLCSVTNVSCQSVYRNNMIRLGIDAAGASITKSVQINGINDYGSNTYYHNSVYIGGSSVVSGSVNTFAFTGAPGRTIMKNIFVNVRSNTSGSGKHYLIKVAGTAPNPVNLLCDGNLYYFSGTGTTFGFFNSATVSSLSSWRTATGQDMSSQNFNPLFAAPTGNSSTVDLHLSSSSTVPSNSSSYVLSNVTNDYDGNTRSINTTDVGADEVLSSNANLSSLTISSGTLSPSFAAATIAYTASVVNAISSVTVTPTQTDVDATIQVRKNSGSYATVTSGNASNAQALSVGSNTIDVKVTAEDGTTIITYTITVTRAAANTLDNLGLTSSTAALGAYSLRKLSSSYTGNAIQVRRSSNGTLSDIGFTADGHLDTTALKTFISTSSAYVSIWYDQSGNGYNAVQTSNSNSLQPRIMTSGVIERANGVPRIFFGNSANANLSVPATSISVTSGTGRYIGGVAKIDVYKDYGVLFSNLTTNDFGLHSSISYTTPNNQAYLYNGSTATTFSGGFTSTSQFLFGLSSTSARINGGTSVSFSTVTNLDGLLLGNSPITGQNLNGSLSEFVLMTSTPSTTNRQLIEASQTAYYITANANLSALTTTAGTISPSFAVGTTAYTASVSNATTSVTVTPTQENANASIQVRVNSGSYTTVASGGTSSALSLNVGSNTIDVKVTAFDG
ncbi:MAG: cadherin-like beta sandwich domain-containing protein, partial [Chitinophagaceae bacterium]|nr:cadherin-like beta sandwich domain-containing protein [Chitinophagaceae bacterium]